MREPPRIARRPESARGLSAGCTHDLRRCAGTGSVADRWRQAYEDYTAIVSPAPKRRNQKLEFRKMAARHPDLRPRASGLRWKRIFLVAFDADVCRLTPKTNPGS